MAAPSKRGLGENVSQVCLNKKQKTQKDESVTVDDVDGKRLEDFLKWCKENNFNLTPKVTVGKKGSCSQYGMVAVEDIAEGYCLFQVPRSCLLTPENTDISSLIEEEASKLDVQNKWIPLLLALIHEQNPNSKSQWRPYLDLVPDYESLDLPLFWDRTSIDNLLKNSKVDDSVARDLKMIQSDFDDVVVPFFQRHKKIGSDLKDLEHFKKMVAFIMAYSFTEPAPEKEDKSQNGGKDQNEESSDEDEEEEEKMCPPMMVPMADMLNHVTNHNAKLTFGTDALKMVTTRNIAKGEEIFNTYGEVSNLHLMHMYGFTEPFPDNVHDLVEIPVTRMLEAARKIKSSNADTDVSALLNKKWKFLLDQDVLLEDDIFVLSREGILTDDICTQALKVMCMSQAEFVDHLEKEGWSDAESESSLSGETSLSFEKIPNLDDKWVSLIQRMAQVHMDGYNTTLSEDEKKLQGSSTLPKREKYALFLVHGQKTLLKKLIDACSHEKDVEIKR